MEISELLQDIADKIRENKGCLELTDHLGNNCIYDHEKCVPIRNLVLDADNEAAVVIPLGYFSDNMIEKVHSSIK